MFLPPATASLLGAIVVLGVVTPVDGRIVHLRCRDGVLVRRLCAEGCPQPVCDRDARCDGVCTFGLELGAQAGCPGETLTVAVGQREVVPFIGAGGLQTNWAVLICRRHPPRVPCPQPGGPCTSDADCPRLLGNPCVQCRTGVCESDPRCF